MRILVLAEAFARRNRGIPPMSTTTATPANTPEMALLLANIARAQEETAKFAAEQRKPAG